MHATQIILLPLVTEKGTQQSSDLNTYTFKVHLKANKTEIKQAIESLYNVKVADVRTLVRKGKPRRTKTGYIHTSEWKRALVKLEGDAKIELF